MRTSDQHYEELLARLSALGGVAVAYSGGVDSTLLACAARDALGERAVAVLATSPIRAHSEAEQARSIARELGLTLIETALDELADPAFCENTAERCYFCKRALFARVRGIADARGLTHVAEGSTADDLLDHRPGARAAAEQGVVSPLQDAGLTKRDIRRLARERGLPNWDKPAMACLATRIPYGERIDVTTLARIDQAESDIASLGLRRVRVRAHGDIARIEVAPDELERAFSLRDRILSACREAGFLYAALDLQGYRTGSMNEALRRG